MFWPFDKPTPKPRAQPRADWRPQGPPPKVGQAARVVFADGYEHARGWVVAILADGHRVICDPRPDHKYGPWITEWPLRQVEAIPDAPDYPHEVITATREGMMAGSDVWVRIRERNETVRARFVLKTLDYIAVQFIGGVACYPAADVEPCGVTASAVLDMRERLQISSQEALRVLKGRALREELEAAASVNDLRPILEALLDKAYPDLHPALKAREERLNQALTVNNNGV